MTITKSRTGLRRGAAASKIGCNAETIRYYETTGLIPDPPRNTAGHRVYEEEDLARLEFVLKLRNLGFALDDVRSLLGTTGKDGPNCGEVAKIADRQLGSIREKIDNLQRLERALTDLVSQCRRGDAPSCALIDALSEP